MSRTVAFATLGCRLNQVDTQQLQGLLEARGFRTVDSSESADVVVVNTCTVTARAELSDRQAIRRAARVSPHARLVVTGCWAQTNPWAVAALPGVDLVVGNADKHRLPERFELILAEAADYARLVQTQESQQIAGALGVLTILGLPLGTALSILQVLGDSRPRDLVLALASALAATAAALTTRYGRRVLSSLRGGRRP